ncbi:MAG: hypothetical protein Q7S74_02710 [Nanoarchaeota archaeon]|nr:hypothetical protein [Nanoarchaeota archaeon]
MEDDNQPQYVRRFREATRKHDCYEIHNLLSHHPEIVNHPDLQANLCTAYTSLSRNHPSDKSWAQQLYNLVSNSKFPDKDKTLMQFRVASKTTK